MFDLIREADVLVINLSSPDGDEPIEMLALTSR